jgi:hypothetical protein
VKLHHIGIVCNETDIRKFFFRPKKKFIYIDKLQNNKLIIERNNHNNLWMEFVIPKNEKSTVYNYLAKNGPGIHHFGYKVDNLLDQKKKLIKKKGFLFVNSFEINISCFGGPIKTMFFFNNNFFIELLSNVKKK